MVDIPDKLILEYKPRAEKNCRLVDDICATFNTNGFGSGFEYIHPMMQQAVSDILERISNGPYYLKELWVFGSSITWMLHLDSDLDIMLVVSNGIDLMSDDKVILEIDRILRVSGIKQDILCENESVFEECKLIDGMIDFDISHDGFKIWERC